VITAMINPMLMTMSKLFMADYSQADAPSGAWSMKPVPDHENRLYRYVRLNAPHVRSIRRQ
jgi:hypothetical protein